MKQLNNIEEIKEAINAGHKVAIPPTRDKMHVSGGKLVKIIDVIEDHESGCPLLCSDSGEDHFYTEGDDVQNQSVK